MRNDPIVEMIRQIRQKHTKEFGGDLRAICEDLRRMERESGRKYVSYEPRRTGTRATSGSAGDGTTRR